MSDNSREDILYALYRADCITRLGTIFSDPIFVLFCLSYIYTKFRSKVFSHGKKMEEIANQKELSKVTPAEINMEDLLFGLFEIFYAWLV